MSTAATRSTQPAPTLHLALDLGNRIWKSAFATSIAHAPRLRTMPARDLTQLDAEIAAAKARFGRRRRTGGELLRSRTGRFLAASRPHRSGHNESRGRLGEYQ
jgi:hypothetical protein